MERVYVMCIGLAWQQQSHQIISDDVVKDDWYFKPSGAIGSQVQLSKHT